MELNVYKTFAWTDSSFVLSWVNYEANGSSTFSANRKTEVRECTNSKWNHVSSHQHPADCASRGVDPSCWKQNTNVLLIPQQSISARLIVL